MAISRSSTLTWCTKLTKKDLITATVGLSLILFSFSFLFKSPKNTAIFTFTSDYVPLTLLSNAKQRGAFCLDGSLPGYHFQKGFGSGSRRWVLHIEGGGWCDSVATCSLRKATALGSSKYMDQQVQFSGILSNDPAKNPDFFNWNKVKIRYCDGSSFAGRPENESHNGTNLFFRGQRIWEASVDELLAKGMSNARQALLSGCSAGGLATMIHCDDFRAKLPNTATVKCLADASFFLDDSTKYPIMIAVLTLGQGVNEQGLVSSNSWGSLVLHMALSMGLEFPPEHLKDVGGRRTLQLFYKDVVNLHGAAKSLPRDCVDKMDPSMCFFPQQFVGSIKTPFFLVNPAYDWWQIQHVLVPAASDLSDEWQRCRLNIQNCNSHQVNILQGFRNSLLNALGEFKRNKERGLFINSCFIHCQTWMDTWHGPNSPKVNNKTIAETVGDWYFNKELAKRVDCPFPCNPSCINMDFTQP